LIGPQFNDLLMGATGFVLNFFHSIDHQLRNLSKYHFDRHDAKRNLSHPHGQRAAHGKKSDPASAPTIAVTPDHIAEGGAPQAWQPGIDPKTQNIALRLEATARILHPSTPF
jgi:hypothetical protein